MPKTIMISGPHAIGKSATAKALAEGLTGYLYIDSFAGRIARELGYNINTKQSPEDVLKYQRAVLQSFQMHYDMTLEQPTVYDRSPLDFAVYTMLQLRNESAFGSQVADYVQECMKTTTAFCDRLIIPEADLTEAYEDKGNRPSFSDDQVKYRQAYHSILVDLANQLTLVPKIIVPVEYQYEERVKFVINSLKLMECEA